MGRNEGAEGFFAPIRVRRLLSLTLAMSMAAAGVSAAEPEAVAKAHSAGAFQIVRDAEALSGHPETLNQVYSQDVIEAGEKSVQVTLERGAEVRIGRASRARVGSDQTLTLLKGRALLAPMDDRRFEFKVSDVVIRHAAPGSEPGHPSILVLESEHPNLVRLDSLRGEWELMDRSREKVIARVGEREGLDLARGETHKRELLVAGAPERGSEAGSPTGGDPDRDKAGWLTRRRAVIFTGGAGLLVGTGFAVDELLEDDDDDDDDDDDPAQTSPVAP